MAKADTIDFPVLFKRTSGGQIQQWHTWVVPGADGVGIIWTEYGLVGGKLQKIQEVIREGRNLGKKNATTPLQQAALEAEAAWTKQRDRKKYGTDPTGAESAAKRAAAPMLAHPYEKHAKKVQWGHQTFAQPKLDGFRCLTRKEGGVVSMVSREGKPITTMAHIASILADIIPDGTCLDGELWTPDLTFQQVASAIKRQQDLSQVVQYHVYDTIEERQFESRLSVIHDLVGAGVGNRVIPVETVQVDSEADLMEYQANCLKDGFEGAMLRWGENAYEAGKRSDSLLKVKTFRDEEFRVVAAVQGRGTHLGMAIFTCETAQGAKFDVTAPGSHADKQNYWRTQDQWIGKHLTVKFFEYTSGDLPVPRFPVAVRFRG